jgi:hypothetical protein
MKNGEFHPSVEDVSFKMMRWHCLLQPLVRSHFLQLRAGTDVKNFLRNLAKKLGFLTQAKLCMHANN